MLNHQNILSRIAVNSMTAMHNQEGQFISTIHQNTKIHQIVVLMEIALQKMEEHYIYQFILSWKIVITCNLKITKLKIMEELSLFLKMEK